MQFSSSNAAQLICHLKESGAQGSGGPQDRHLGERVTAARGRTWRSCFAGAVQKLLCLSVEPN